MASRRAKKKAMKKELQKSGFRSLQNLQALNPQNAEINNEIKKLKRELKRKNQTTSKLRVNIGRINELSERNLLNTFNQKISLSDLKTYAERARDSGDNYNNAEHWAAIKRYNELVDLGLIPRGSIFDKYDAAEYMQNILSPEQINRMTKQAEEKASFLRAQSVVKQRSNYSFD